MHFNRRKNKNLVLTHETIITANGIGKAALSCKSSAVLIWKEIPCFGNRKNEHYSTQFDRLKLARGQCYKKKREGAVILHYDLGGRGEMPNAQQTYCQ